MQSIFLIGTRGAGKTTIGKMVAAELGTDFYDSDDLICNTTGCSIAEIIDDGGWQKFRNLEAQVLESCLHFPGAVVATGGGAVLHQEVWRQIKQYALVVWLTAPVDVLIRRVIKDTANRDNRPALTGGTPEEEFKAVLKERAGLYKALAHHVIDTSTLDRTGIVADIIRFMKDDH